VFRVLNSLLLSRDLLHERAFRIMEYRLDGPVNLDFQDLTLVLLSVCRKMHTYSFLSFLSQGSWLPAVADRELVLPGYTCLHPTTCGPG
jgi:hypothetical protein